MPARRSPGLNLASWWLGQPAAAIRLQKSAFRAFAALTTTNATMPRCALGYTMTLSNLSAARAGRPQLSGC